jgi:hypothetical protein
LAAVAHAKRITIARATFFEYLAEDHEAMAPLIRELESCTKRHPGLTTLRARLSEFERALQRVESQAVAHGLVTAGNHRGVKRLKDLTVEQRLARRRGELKLRRCVARLVRAGAPAQWQRSEAAHEKQLLEVASVWAIRRDVAWPWLAALIVSYYVRVFTQTWEPTLLKQWKESSVNPPLIEVRRADWPKLPALKALPGETLEQYQLRCRKAYACFENELKVAISPKPAIPCGRLRHDTQDAVARNVGWFYQARVGRRSRRELVAEAFPHRSFDDIDARKVVDARISDADRLLRAGPPFADEYIAGVLGVG